jgi:exosortase/archaeosortase family protein
MAFNSESSPDQIKIVKIWTGFVVLSLLLFLIATGSTYFKLDAFGVWVLSCIGVLYLGRKKIDSFRNNERTIVIFLGICAVIFSFISISIGFSRPPYSIGEYSLLLSGAGLILFGLLYMRSLVLPVALPGIAVLGYSSYELFLRHQEWLTAPLIPVTVSLSTTVLNCLGIATLVQGNVISFLSVQGEPIYLSIISDCTGIESLGTFTIATLIVLVSFPQCITKKSILPLFIGFLGTYIANIGRIVVISLSGYYFGPVGVIEQVHVHIGWIIFSTWMIIFWYYFFTRHVGLSFFKKGRAEKNMAEK